MLSQVGVPSQLHACCALFVWHRSTSTGVLVLLFFPRAGSPSTVGPCAFICGCQLTLRMCRAGLPAPLQLLDTVEASRPLLMSISGVRTGEYPIACRQAFLAHVPCKVVLTGRASHPRGSLSNAPGKVCACMPLFRGMTLIRAGIPFQGQLLHGKRFPSPTPHRVR